MQFDEDKIWRLFQETLKYDPMAWLNSCMQAMGMWVGWHVDDDIGGHFNGHVRQVDKCDAVQHTEQIVDTLDALHDAPAIVCVTWLACHCIITATMKQIGVDMCEDHEYMSDGKDFQELWAERYKEHFADTTKDMHMKSRDDLKAKTLLTEEFLKDLGL
jgi:hypothetical protein